MISLLDVNVLIVLDNGGRLATFDKGIESLVPQGVEAGDAVALVSGGLD